MAMVAPMPMTTDTLPMTIDARLLTLAQWLSPSFPIGGFAYSHGLEAAIWSGWIADAPGLEAWLGELIADGSGRADAIWLWQGWHAPDAGAATEADTAARAFATSRERLREADRMGAAFAATVRAVWGLDPGPLLLPVAVGRAARLAGIAGADAAALYLQSFVSNLVSAAVRLVPLGQTEGQQVLAALSPACLQMARDTAGARPGDVFSNTFLSDVAAMRHETQEPRLFQS